MRVTAESGHASALIAAILVYGRSVSHQGVPRAEWLSIHDVEQCDGKQPVIAPGRAATREGLRQVLDGIAGKQRHVPALFQPNLLAQGDGYLVWWVPPMKRQVWFNAEAPIGARTGEVPLPGLVFMVNLDTNRGWHVYAVKGSDRPTANTPLFKAPFFNVWEGGAVCVGNVATPTKQAAMQPEAWGDAFFRSYFTHPNIHKDLVNYRPGIYQFWNRLLDGKWESFPDDRLVSANTTVAAEFAKLMKGGE